MMVSVVVPTCRRPEHLRRCLERLLEQTLERFEIVVSDDGDDAATRETVESFMGSRPGVAVSYARPGVRRGPAAARNRGWRLSRGELIAFTDDDCVPARDWLKRGLEAIESGLDAAMGRIVVPLPTLPSDHELSTLSLEHARRSAANIFVRRGAFCAAGGFDERYRLPSREASDLRFTLIEKGFRVGRAPKAVVVHAERAPRFGATLRQQRGQHLYEALLYRKHPELYRLEAGRRPVLYYASSASAACAAAGLIAGDEPLLLCGGAAWLAATARLFLKRRAARGLDARGAAELAVSAVGIPPLAVYWRLRGALRFRTAFF